MRVEVIREPAPPPIKEVVLHLSEEEARILRGLICRMSRGEDRSTLVARYLEIAERDKSWDFCLKFVNVCPTFPA